MKLPPETCKMKNPQQTSQESGISTETFREHYEYLKVFKIVVPTSVLQFQDPKIPGYSDFISLLLASCTRHTSDNFAKSDSPGEEYQTFELGHGPCSALLRRTIRRAVLNKLEQIKVNKNTI